MSPWNSLFLASLLSASLQAQSVLVVDAANGPGADFASLDAAIRAAASGDVLLVRSGDYEVFVGTSVAKSLVIQADRAAVVNVSGLVVEDLLARDRVLVRGLSFLGIPATRAVTVRDCQGSVWFEDCSLPGAEIPGFSTGGATVADSASVVFDGCRFGPVVDFAFCGCSATTLSFLRSTVHLFDCAVSGQDGFDSGSAPADGAVAARVVDGELWLVGSTLTGGKGGSGTSGGFASVRGADGESALVLEGVSPKVLLQDSHLAGGAAGLGFGGAPDGASAPAIRAPVGIVATLPGTARGLETSSPLRDDERSTVTLRGLPGDQVWLVGSLRPAARSVVPSVGGPFLLFAPRFVFPAGTLGPSGTRTLSFPPTALAPGVEALSVHLQALFWNPVPAERVWSAPSHVLLVDAAF